METPLQVGAYSPDNWAWDSKQEMWLRVQQLCRGQELSTLWTQEEDGKAEGK